MRNLRMRHQRLADERGWVLVSATILTLLMLSIAMVAAGMIDNTTKRTREQRERESALNVDEGVLYAQSLVMQTAWPSAAKNDPVTGNPQYYPGTCTSSGSADRRCPNPASLVAANSGNPASSPRRRSSSPSSPFSRARDRTACTSRAKPRVPRASRSESGQRTDSGWSWSSSRSTTSCSGADSSRSGPT